MDRGVRRVKTFSRSLSPVTNTALCLLMILLLHNALLRNFCLTFKWLQNVGRMRALASATPEVNTGLLMQALIARILALTKGGGQDSLGKLSNISEVSLDRSNGVKTSRKCGYVDTMWSKKTTCPLESITTRSQIIALI